MAAPADLQGLCQQVGWVELLEPFYRPQVALAVELQATAKLLNRRIEPNRGEQILQRLTLAVVQVDITTGDHRQIEGSGQLIVVQVLLLLVGNQVVAITDPEPVWK